MEINTFSVYSTISEHNDLSFINYDKAITLVEKFEDITNAEDARRQIKNFFGESLSTEYSLGNNNFCRIADEIKYYKVKINIDSEIMIYYFEK